MLDLEQDLEPDVDGFVPRKYGFPFRSYDNARTREEIDRHDLAVDSRDFVIQSEDGTLRRRAGMTNLGGTAGILEAGTTFNTYTTKGTKLQEFRSKALGTAVRVGLSALLVDEDADMGQL